MKNRNVRNTAILILVFAALAVYFFTSEDYFGGGNNAQSTPGALPQMYEFATNQAVELTVTSGVTRTLLRREDDTKPWMLVEPISDEADSVLVNGAIERMSRYQASRVFTDTETVGELAGFGLDTPEFTATVKLNDGTAYVLVAGDKTPEMVNRYAQKEGAPGVFVIADSLATDFQSILNKPPVKPTPTATIAPITPITDTVIVTESAPLTSPAPLVGAPEPLTNTVMLTGVETVTVTEPITAAQPITDVPVLTDTGPMTSTESLTNTDTVTM